MEENKNPFEKKDPTTEIEDILNESPIEDIPKSKPQLKTYDLKKKLKRPKKKTIIIIGVILVILIGGFALVSNGGDDSNNTETTSNTETTNNISLVDSIKQQIIEKGYAEIGEGNSKMILAPYIG